ncbi:MAG: hypothetical protein ACFE0K_06660, partial [Alcanivorax sp.]|uniref:hypothetical protein n=1 Tax=Alcanivorax sp. TaxID=1872427 RepID=UPI003DA7A5E0
GMKNGCHRYRCYPDQGLSPGPRPVPTSALAGGKVLDWHSLESLDRDSWRFGYQFDLFLEVVGSAILEEQANPQ